MNQQLQKVGNDITPDHNIVTALVLQGDLSRMTEDQKVGYYKQFCESLGLNPLTQPFQLINFQGKQRMYATKDCTEQLRKLHGVSITDVTGQTMNGVYIATAKAQDKTGKSDVATGVVFIDGLKGENLANALMKAETKAKRRVTLSICGLGMLDESETDSIHGATKENLRIEPQLTVGPAIVDDREKVKKPTKTEAGASMQHDIDVKKAIKDAERCGSVSALSHFIEGQPESIRKDTQFQGACIAHKQNLVDALQKETV